MLIHLTLEMTQEKGLTGLSDVGSTFPCDFYVSLHLTLARQCYHIGTLPYFMISHTLLTSDLAHMSKWGS